MPFVSAKTRLTSHPLICLIFPHKSEAKIDLPFSQKASLELSVKNALSFLGREVNPVKSKVLCAIGFSLLALAGCASQHFPVD